MTAGPIIPAQGSVELLDGLRARNLDVLACYQCGKCSAGCPISPYFDLLPMEVVRLAAYGMEAPLLSSRTIWLCASCETCTTRCPNEVDIAGLMDFLRELCLGRGHAPAEPRVPIFHQAFLGSVRRWGRTYELGMLGAYKVRSGDLTGDMRLGMSMLGKGKIHLVPHPIEARREVKKIFERAGKAKQGSR